MRRWRVGTISMGILLIAVGMILFVSEIKGLSGVEQIIRWWPLILIILGVEVLIYVALSKEEQPKVKFDGFSIFIIIIVIIVSLGAYGVRNFINSEIGGNIYNRIIPYKYESVFEKQFNLKTGDKSNFVIENSFGNIEIEKASGNDIEIEAIIKMKNNDEEYAKEIAESVIDIDEQGLKIDTKKDTWNSRKIQSINVNYLVKVPDGINVELKNGFGKVSVEDIKSNVKVENESGGISVKDIDGTLDVVNSFGSVEVDNISGSTNIENENSYVNASNIKSDLFIENSFGKVEIDNIMGKVEIENENGEIVAKSVKKDIITKNSFNKVSLDEIGGNANITNNNGNVCVEEILGNLNIEDSFGSIEIKNVDKKIVVNSSNGNVNLENDQILNSDVVIKNSFGKVELNIPKEQNGKMKLYTKFGVINDEFGLSKEKGENKESIDQSIKNEDITIDIDNDNGDIILYSK